MRFAERPGPGDAAFVQQTAERMDHRGLKRFASRQLRQDSGNAGGEHGFAGPRRTHHHQVVPPGSRDFERPFGAFLSLDLAQVAGQRISANLAGLRRRNRGLACEMAHNIRQGLGTDHLRCANPCSLGA